ncbi:Use1 domain-containing protein [Cephalotus follicularis]|uniref:Use1 domain-containing protein n=1 Tax=Cephalotus follicularis TaxID=3775 RepID=A0A1Q3AVI3_CEPFO|nr:Use1 domain-containing protein [Cephalotus follicularis]
MAISKTEVNMRRLLASAPQQQNQAKLLHYVATLREQLEQLAEERTKDGLPRIPRAKVNEYSEAIEAIASKLAVLKPDDVQMQLPEQFISRNSFEGSPSRTEGENNIPPQQLRRRFVPASNMEDRTTDSNEVDGSTPIKLDVAAQAHIEKHRKLQEDLTDEMVGLAQQLKESSLMMSHSLQNTEKILDSTEKAVEHSLASTGHANVRAMQIYAESSKTTCFTWLAFLVMTCVFVMVVLLIRVT